MKMKSDGEKSLRSWFRRGAYGLAQIVDGVVFTLTLGYISTGLGLEASRRLAASRARNKASTMEKMCL